ncbi:unnamed protein product [Caenorhabditis sp. 36 PRJEB53466]|nr:unnamed protein product [Caenorhabditis sp. 36 PRJEB53466]
MLYVLLYFALNISGFFVFLAVWNRLPKPKPFDYTTIPGLKLNVSSAEEIPDLVKKPGDAIDEKFKGHMDKLKKHQNFREFLFFMNLTYGPLSSFWWSTRYVVIVSNETFVAELKKFSASLIAISPFAIGSYLQGEKKYCTCVEYNTLNMKRTEKTEMDKNLLEEVQCELLLDVDDTEKTDVVCDISQTLRNLRQAGFLYSNDRKSFSRPLMVIFDEEIWVDAHPIPKFVPIIIHTEEIIRNWTDSELFSKFYSQFHWLPGFSMLNGIL